MAFTDNSLTVREALGYLALNGIDWTEVWLRTQIGTGAIQSFKIKHMRLIARSEIDRVIHDWRDKHRR